MITETPTSRINIRLDLNQNGSTERCELPLKLLCLGAFYDDPKPLKQRDHIKITARNFNQVLSKLQPTVTVGATKTLCFKHLKDFEPGHLGLQIPACQDLIAMRNLLKDLRSLAQDNGTFCKQLNALLQQPAHLKALLVELQRSNPLTRINPDDAS
jgi:type VI secretion system ImpB/VipA family protein